MLTKDIPIEPTVEEIIAELLGLTAENLNKFCLFLAVLQETNIAERFSPLLCA